LDEFPDARRVASKSLHMVPKMLRQMFIKLGGRDKLELLEEVIMAHKSPRSLSAVCKPTLGLAPIRPELAATLANQVPTGFDTNVAPRTVRVPTIVFTNTVIACRAASLFLASRGYNVACYHGAMPPNRRAESFNSFVRGERNIMVCTDLGSRGLDTSMVKHVIMMDFPKTMQDYLHRAGRTARAGMKGVVTCFVKARDVPLARTLETSVGLDPRDDRRVVVEASGLVKAARVPVKGKKRIWFDKPGVPRKGPMQRTTVVWRYKPQVKRVPARPEPQSGRKKKRLAHPPN